MPTLHLFCRNLRAQKLHQASDGPLDEKEDTDGDSEKGFACIISTISLEFLRFPSKGLSWIGKNCQTVSGVSKRAASIRRLKRSSNTSFNIIRSNPSSKRASLIFAYDRDV
jgi:hypothetical protein